MKLSFIVPVYNARLYLSRCLDSLLDQSINDFEIICINDGSTDDSLDILREYEKKFPEIIKVLTQKNHGIGSTRNTALKIVSGKYTWFIDNDDCIQKDCLSPLIKVFDETDADIINIKYLHGFYETNPLNQDINGQFNYEKISQEFAMYFYWDAPWSKIYKTEFLKKMVQHLVMFSGKIHPSHLIYILKLQVYIELINIYMHGLKDLIVIVIT